MIYTISLPYTDDFTRFMFKRIVDELAPDVPTYYMWSNPPSTMSAFLTRFKSNAPVVFIAIKDLLDCWKEFNFWHDQQQEGSKIICEMAQRNPETVFVLFTSMRNLNLEINEPNVHIVYWGGDWVNQKDGYINLEPVLDKNFSSEKTFICLNRNVRDHRIVNLSYLFGRGYNNHGVISYLGKSILNFETEPMEFLDRVCWEFEERHDAVRECMLSGYRDLLTSTSLVTDEYNIYENYASGHRNDNISNFNARLRPMYRNSFVEIVTESSFVAPAYMITEKTANSMFGCNFPILLGGCGIVQHLRDLGFDMFDDVVDHSYDLISNPFDRITTAIDNNKQLLTDAEFAKQAWVKCRDRFEHNVKVYPTIFEWHEKHVRQQLAKILENL